MAQPAMGLLVAGFDFSAVDAGEFNDWYDTEHVPERRRVPGFVNCERWIGADAPRLSIATYDLASLAVLQTPAYRAIAGENLSPWSKRMTGKCRRICRFEAEQVIPGHAAAPEEAGGLLLYAMNWPAAQSAEFEDWYQNEHVPRLAAVPGVLAARRFRIEKAISDGNQRSVALYHLAAPEVSSSPEWRAAADTPWTIRLRPNIQDRLRLVLRRYRRAR